MLVEQPLHEFFPEDFTHLSHIRRMIESAIVDGRLSRTERDDIMSAIYANHRVSAEECALMRGLQQKIWTGEVYIED